MRLRGIGCCTSGAGGDESGLPINVVLVANGADLLHALLRSGWHENVPTRKAIELPRPQTYWRDRPPDAVFRKRRSNAGDRNELRLWLTPMRADGVDVWVAQAHHYVTDFLQLLSLDPDVDDASVYLLQSFWYGQSLEKYAWLDKGIAVPFSRPVFPFTGPHYFTDGYWLVMWISGSAVSMLDAKNADWDVPPIR